MANLPTGTITFLFTDIEGSTRLLAELGADYSDVLERHQRLLRDAIGRHNGVEVSTDGDSFFCVFTTADDALAAAVDMQRSLAEEDWGAAGPVKVRMGLHTGVAALGGDNYVGMDVHRAARISEVGHGGQVLLSAATHLLGAEALPDGVTFKDIGELRLRDLDHPEHVYQLAITGLQSDFPPPRKVGAATTNLPRMATPLIGRDTDQVAVAKLMDEARLVTITGVAGAGKTRLAIAVANTSRETHREGVWFVPLASVASDDLVSQAAASAIGLQESQGCTAVDVITDYVATGRHLLVFDNCEHVVDGVASLVAQLLAAVPDLTILTTSRQILGVPGEVRYPCPPLGVPDVGVTSRTAVLASASVELFEARAHEVNPSFTLDDENADDVAAICRTLDGMPLAIELAAALVRILTPREIAERLDRRFDLLRGGPRTAPLHHQTLLAAFESTFDLLDERHRDFALRLGVFVGGFDASAAEAVASADGDDVDVLEALSALVDRSLVTRAQAGDRSRLTILGSVREFLLHRLEETDRLDALQERHAHFFDELVARGSNALRGPEQDEWAARLDTDIGNIRAAIEYLADRGDDRALQLVDRMFLYWRRQGEWSDGLHWCRVALEQTPDVDSGRRARVLATAGFFASDLGRGGRSVAEMEAGLEMARRIGDLHAEGYCCSFLGAELSRRDTDLDRGVALLGEAQRIYADLGEPYGEAWVNRYLGLSHQERGEFEESVRLQTLSLRAFQEAGDIWNVRFSQTLLAEAMHTIGELGKSRELYDESLKGSSEARFKVVIAQALKGLGKVSLAQGRLSEATDHLTEALQALREIGDVAGGAETRGHLAMVKLGLGHPGDAKELLTASLMTFRDIADQGGVAWALERVAAVAVDRADHGRAAELLAAADLLREVSGSPRSPVHEPEVEQLRTEIADVLGAAERQVLTERGRAKSLDDVIELALGGGV
jgi:predicted ATPase/class 3 adenylate cyclase